jgi:hypothetical protein
MIPSASSFGLNRSASGQWPTSSKLRRNIEALPEGIDFERRHSRMPLRDKCREIFDGDYSDEE